MPKSTGPGGCIAASSALGPGFVSRQGRDFVHSLRLCLVRNTHNFTPLPLHICLSQKTHQLNDARDAVSPALVVLNHSHGVGEDLVLVLDHVDELENKQKANESVENVQGRLILQMMCDALMLDGSWRVTVH